MPLPRAIQAGDKGVVGVVGDDLIESPRRLWPWWANTLLRRTWRHVDPISSSATCE